MRKRWILCVAASAMFVVGAVSAEQPRVENLALSVPSPASASSHPAVVMDAVAVRAAIEGANAQWLKAFRDGDSISLARIYAPDASLFPPANASLEGRDRIVEYFGAQRRAGMGDASLKTLDVVCVGDVAYEVGTYSFRFDSGDSGSSTAGDSGRYFAIWKSQDDGSWRYQVGIWSSNRDVALKP